MKRLSTISLFVLLSSLQAACSHSVSSTLTLEGMDNFRSTLWVEDSNGIDGDWHSDNIVPYFNFIPGSIFGSPSKDVLLPIEVDEESRIVVRLSDWDALAETAASPLTKRNLESGLRVQPPDVRFLRVGTLAYDLTHDTGMGGGLREIGMNGYIILVYVDRPCVFSGGFELDGTTYTHDIDLPAKGFHYILSDESDHLSRRRIQTQLLFVTKH